MPMREDFLMTIEPGLYFVPALLDDPEKRARFRDAVNWDSLDRWRPVGGGQHPHHRQRTGCANARNTKISELPGGELTTKCTKDTKRCRQIVASG
jgi:hypothetical protein